MKELVRHLEAGDIVTFRRHLDGTASPELLTMLREHKVLLKTPTTLRDDAASAMVTAADRVLGASERGCFARQLELLALVADRAEKYQAAVDAMAGSLPPMSLGDLLQTAQRTFDRFARQFVDSEKQWYDPERPVGLVEREWHDLNGRIADLIAAVCRAVNASSSRLDPRRRLRDGGRAGAAQTMARMVSLCSVLNGLDWVRDSTAFGDLDVTSIERGEPPVVTLEFRDPRRSLLRTLSTRREVVMEAFAERPSRVVGRWLEHNAAASIGNAVERYLGSVGASPSHRLDNDMVGRSVDMHLKALDLEDDMLLVSWARDRRIVGRYLLSSMLQWSEIAAHAVARCLPKSAARRFLPAPITLAELMGDIADRSLHDVMREAWAEATIPLPAANHWDLVRRPFVREADEVARPLLHGATGKWNAAIRERLLRGGAFAKAVGSAWERYFADRFRENGWEIVGEGVKLRVGGSFLTDIDLLVARDDLLLVVQVKALGGAALNPYDHWKYRKVIEKGCWQASVAHRRLRADRALILGVAGRAVANRIRVLKPIVLTNLGLFDGWEHAGVPVLGETLLKSITVGSKVDYVDPLQKRIVHTRHLLRPEELTTETIVKALGSPIELAIAPERGTVAYVTEQVAGIAIRVPQFTVADTQAPTFASPPS